MRPDGQMTDNQLLISACCLLNTPEVTLVAIGHQGMRQSVHSIKYYLLGQPRVNGTGRVDTGQPPLHGPQAQTPDLMIIHSPDNDK